MKIKSINKSWLAILSGSGALALLLLMAILCPICSSEADAAECTDQNPSACPTQSASTKASVNVTTIISVALDSQVDLEVVPDANGQFTSATANLSVSTNSAAGYKVLLSTAGSNNALTGPMVGESRTKIDAIEQNTTKANFPSNTWGYNLGNTSTITDTTVFSSVPISTAQTVIRETDMPSTDNYSLNFGAKVDNTLASGEYSNDIIVSAIANPRKATIADISTMQDMNSEICANTAEGYTKQLIDTRDNKSYWVAKLKDGNCWMTQNLALDITTAGLKASDTDIESDWNSSSTYPPTSASVWGTGISGATDMGIYHWSGGLYPLVKPTEYNSCGYTASNFYECISKGVVSPSSAPSSHYTIGHYYSWNAAAAGTGTADGTSTGSVCPKNWTLPDTSQYNSMFSAYGIASSNSSKNPTGAPLYMTQSGGITINTGTAGMIGGGGFYQTKGAQSGANIGTSYASAGPSSTIAGQGNGASVRCVAR